MSGEPLVSVVIPTYNHRNFVLRALESVEAQNWRHHEIIVVNDGSPDDTASLLRPLGESGRIRYIEQTNAGQAPARNRGIAEAKGEFIALLDDDDVWPVDKLQWQMEAMQAHPEVAVVYGPAVSIDAEDKETVPLGEDGKPLVLPWEKPTGWVYERFIQQNWILSPGQCLIRRTALEGLPDATPFDTDPELRGCDDWDLWCRLAERYQFLYRDQVALRYRFHGANASRDVLQMHRSTLKMFPKHLARQIAEPGLPSGLSVVEREKLLRLAYQKAQEWSANDLLTRAKADRLRGGAKDSADSDPEAALQKLNFLGQTQPAYWRSSSFLRFFLGTCFAVWRRKQSKPRVRVAADLS